MSSPLLLSKLLLLNLENYSNFGLNEGERGGKVLKPLLILRFFFLAIMTMKQCIRKVFGRKNLPKIVLNVLENQIVANTKSANTKGRKCEICEKIYKTKISLKNHFNSVHNNVGKTSKCNRYLFKILSN